MATLLAAALAAPPAAKELVVHEWGTFTTLAGSDGALLPGILLDASPLPDFVHRIPFYEGAGAADRALNVTVKLETPVLYFYSPGPLDIRVEARFPGGTLNHWYPRRSAGEPAPAAPAVDFAQGPLGHIAWEGEVLAPGDTTPLTPPAEQVNAEWRAPRLEGANKVRVGGEVERYLFYRGLGNLDLPLHTAFEGEGNLVLHNRGAADIATIFVYDNTWTAAQKTRLRWQGTLPAGGRVHVDMEAAAPSMTTQTLQWFERGIVNAGLRLDEARALLNTWHSSYFGIERGFKILWVVPRAETDRLLPLSVDPPPDSLERVLIARSEILTPAFEDILRSAWGTAEWEPLTGRHRYRLAFASLAGRPEATAAYRIDRSLLRAARPMGWISVQSHAPASWMWIGGPDLSQTRILSGRRVRGTPIRTMAPGFGTNSVSNK